MLNWYKNLYMGNTAKKKEKHIRRKVNAGKPAIGVYLITLAANPQNHLEIISAIQLQQKMIRERCPMIVGLAEGYEEALELIEKIAIEVYKETGEMDIRSWILKNQERV